MKFAVMGGDMRQVKLAELLTLDGHEVFAFALDKAALSEDIKAAEISKKELEKAECVILPLPAVVNGDYINAPLSVSEYKLEDVLACVDSSSLICAGMVSERLRQRAAEKRLEIRDYFAREEFAVLNAVSTVEGAMEIIIKEMPINLCSSNCLVLGFGRIGKIISHRLKGCGANVTVSARKCSDFAWIEAYGYKWVHTGNIASVISDYDVIINTIPAKVLKTAQLSRIKRGSLCLDLASKPGGIDFDAASHLGVKAIWALGLPGKVSPVSAGAVIKNTIYNILVEQERFEDG